MTVVTDMSQMQYINIGLLNWDTKQESNSNVNVDEALNITCKNIQGCTYFFQSGSHESAWRFGFVLTLPTVWPIKYIYKNKLLIKVILILLHLVIFFK